MKGETKAKQIIIAADDDSFGAVLNCAVRYCIGRQSYMPGLVMDKIRPWLPLLSDKTLWCFERDIQGAASLGDPNVDAPRWRTFMQQNNPSLDELRDEAYRDAHAHGLYDFEKDVPEIEHAAVSLVSKIESEIKEARVAALEWEAHKSGAQDHLTEEMADVIIMTLSACGHLGIDIDAAVKRKMEINKGRPWRHGK